MITSLNIHSFGICSTHPAGLLRPDSGFLQLAPLGHGAAAAGGGGSHRAEAAAGQLHCAAGSDLRGGPKGIWGLWGFFYGIRDIVWLRSDESKTEMSLVVGISFSLILRAVLEETYV